MLDYNSIKGLATSVRHGAIALDTSDKLLVFVAVTFGDGQEDLQATDSGVVEVSHTLAARIEDHHCARGLGRKQQRDSSVVLYYLVSYKYHFSQNNTIKTID